LKEARSTKEDTSLHPFTSGVQERGWHVVVMSCDFTQIGTVPPSSQCRRQQWLSSSSVRSPESAIISKGIKAQTQTSFLLAVFLSLSAWHGGEWEMFPIRSCASQLEWRCAGIITHVFAVCKSSGCKSFIVGV